MKLSIIIPVYNCEQYLSKCLDSIINQNFNDYEIILINDGSKDNSLEIVNEYAKKYSFIKFINQKNSGQGKARNEGLKICNGEYVTFIDSDDFISGNDSLNILYNQCKKYDLDILIYNYNVLVNNRIYNENLVLDDQKVFARREIIRKFLITNEVEGFSCNKFFKRKILIENNIKFLEEKKYEDIPMVVASILKSNKIMFNNIKVYNYVMHKGSTTNSIKLSTLLDEIYSMELVLTLILNENFEQNIQGEVSKYVNYRIDLYCKYRIKNFIKFKLNYKDFNVIMKKYLMIYNKYNYKKLEENNILKLLNLIYGR